MPRARCRSRTAAAAAAGEELHRATLVAQGQFFADVVSTDTWLGRIDRGSGPG